ncbi:MAG: Mrp/NBP35 family ATP-binding protein [Bacteroidota bacterium]|nr:Mrp/NBP35 family ATP-binding protein [Candidatus Kapabacteria bacterium]MCX7937576.1 Mrp/NBP35 family ATP-binding protein [Chlorobiota bacterium]MDW8075894.1 Mrp/NBP35 family ATP-binding protein [Bacteroidota bacterium]MDW8272520.1 Mrp/NBP35 family ATP-binding protein [Bacteroidota bacterium]
MPKEQLIEHLRVRLGALVDPDLGESLLQLGALHNIEAADGSIHIYLELIPPLYRSLAQQLDTAIKSVVEKVDPSVRSVVHARPIAVLRKIPSPVLPEVQDMVAVASGKGGVGKSTVAANLAAAFLLEGLQVGLLDADIYGPSAPTLFGLEGATLEAVKTEEGRVVGYPQQQYGIKIASMGFIMQRDQAAIFRGPMLAGYFRTLVEQIEWGELDVLVFDLPPGTGDVQLTLAQQIPLSGAVIVTTPQQLALADVRRSIAMFRRVNVDILGIIENMSYYIPSDAPEKRYYIFGQGGGKQLAEEAGVPFLGEIPLHDDIRTSTDEGLPVVLNPDAAEPVIHAYQTVTQAILATLRRLNLQRHHSQQMEIRL